MVRRLIVALGVSLSLWGCVSAQVSPSHQRQTVVAIYVELSGNKPVTTPYHAVLTHPSQKVEWYSCDGDVKIKFKPRPNNLPDPACTPQGKKRCEMNAPPAGTKKGDHPYDITLTVNGVPYTDDPVIIVDY